MRRTIIGAGIAAGVLALGGGGGALAQDGVGDETGVTTLDTITVTTPNRTPTEASKVGSTVELVTQDEIEQKSLPVLADYLTRVPGVYMSTTGGPGQQTNIFMRGLPGRYVRTLYNGIDISDPTSTQVQTPYEYLLTGGVTGIEVLKGSQSTLYGSNAIAGVVDISTLGQVPHGIRHMVEIEGGSFGTARGRYGITGANDATRAAANITGFRTDGISAAAGFPERDGYQNVTIDANVEHRINDAFSVFGSGLFVDARADFDDSGADNLFNRNLTEIAAGRAGFNLDLLDGRAKNTVSVQAYRIDRTVRPQDDRYVGTRQKIDYIGSFEATPWATLQYGIDHERQSADITTQWAALDRSHDLTGFWTQAIVEPVEDFVLTAGIRHDRHSEFGGHTTWRGTASYLFAETGTRLHGSAGSGFRAPSLYELYEPSFGNPALRPETSRSFDIGVEQTFLGGALVTDLTLFQLDVNDRIDFFGAGYNQIPGRTRSRGVELSFTYAATDWLDLGGSYTFTDSKTDGGVRNIRVPRHAVVLAATARPAERWTVSADLKYVSDTLDSDFSTWPATQVRLKDYALLNAKVSYQVTDNTEIYVRGENLLDQKYELVRGYGTPGISAFAGIKAKF